MGTSREQRMEFTWRQCSGISWFWIIRITSEHGIKKLLGDDLDVHGIDRQAIVGIRRWLLRTDVVGTGSCSQRRYCTCTPQFPPLTDLKPTSRKQLDEFLQVTQSHVRWRSRTWPVSPLLCLPFPQASAVLISDREDELYLFCIWHKWNSPAYTRSVSGCLGSALYIVGCRGVSAWTQIPHEL